MTGGLLNYVPHVLLKQVWLTVLLCKLHNITVSLSCSGHMVTCKIWTVTSFVVSAISMGLIGEGDNIN